MTYVCHRCFDSLTDIEQLENTLGYGMSRCCQCKTPTDNGDLNRIRSLEPIPHTNPLVNDPLGVDNPDDHWAQSRVVVDQTVNAPIVAPPEEEESKPVPADNLRKNLHDIRKQEKELVNKIKQAIVKKRFDKKNYPTYQHWVVMHRDQLEAILKEETQVVRQIKEILTVYNNLNV